VYDDVPFYRLAHAALSRPGVACFNLFGRRFEPSVARICEAFEDRVLALPEVDAGNRIVIGFAGPPLAVALSALGARARELETRWRLPARRWLAGLITENGISARLEI
jgi:spermidine synthase